MNQNGTSRGFTLLELTVVILVLLSLASIGLFTTRKLDEWKAGRNASETLRYVYSAQRLYLSDHPTVPVASLSAENLIPYLPGDATEMPTVESLTGEILVISVTVSPPVVLDGSEVYDPSGSSTDSLWDVGQ
ncbi:MAG: type II secretion system protein [Verrucomicrobiota bacterium]